MNIEFTTEDKEFLSKALNYVALSLDGNMPDNRKLNDTAKLHVLGNCYYLQQILKNNSESDSNENNRNGVEIKEVSSNPFKNLSPELKEKLAKEGEQLMAENIKNKLDKLNDFYSRSFYYPFG